MTAKTIYRLSNINGRFEHAASKAAAVARANEIEGETALTEADLTRDRGWTFRRLTPAQARATGMAE